MKTKINLLNRTAIIVCAIILNIELGNCKAFHASAANHADGQLLEYKLNAQESEALRNDIGYRKAPADESYYHHHHHFHHRHQHNANHAMNIADTKIRNTHYHMEPATRSHFHYNQHLKELTESAKNPKNLKNGIYQNGAVTYDLGLPHFEIVNPHDQPEIITSDHPHYHQHLNHIQKTNNFTIEDLSVTVMPPGHNADDTAATTTELPETTTTPSVLTTTLPKVYESLKKKINKELSITNEKVRKSNAINKLTPSHRKMEDEVNFVIVEKKDNLRRKLRPSPFRKQTQKYEQQHQSSQKSTEEQTPTMQSNDQEPALNNEGTDEKSSTMHKNTGGQVKETENVPYTYQIGNSLPVQPQTIHKVYTASSPFSPPVSYEYLSRLPGHGTYIPGQAVSQRYTAASPSIVSYKHLSPRQQQVSSYGIERNLDRLYRSATFLNDFK